MSRAVRGFQRLSCNRPIKHSLNRNSKIGKLAQRVFSFLSFRFARFAQRNLTAAFTPFVILSAAKNLFGVDGSRA